MNIVRFNELLKSKLGDSKPLLNEDNNVKSNVTSMCPTLSSKSIEITDITNIFNYYKFKTGNLIYSENGVWEYINNLINQRAKTYNETIKNDRISCQIALNCVRPLVRDKNLIVVDTKQQLIYLFNPNGKFIAKDVIISGEDKQSFNKEKDKSTLIDWSKKVESAGFFWDGKKYIDKTGKNRKYSSDLIYDFIAKNKERYTPQGIYSLKGVETNSDYVGGSNNMISLYKDGNETANAIHGYYNEKKREDALKKGKNILGSITNPEAKKEFTNAISSGQLNLDYSYGCINLSVDFLNVLKKYWTSATLFVISESETNYLVQNPINYFEKMTKDPICPSLESLGAEVAIDNKENVT